ncbi:hypothetical protein OPV22_004033 [Ensete ventricosum]|uniref:YTH domain-containing family protein n=1 Tax=Ensete ventricosum TaxID=4639 RepID=A0AAV8S2M9_ENSVE|nr:hypothetical protein OPV22_004033 [Ensete ventricosum]
MCCYPNGHASSFYYGGYEGPTTEWEAYPRYISPDGSEVPPLGVYGDMYHHGYGYAPYGPWSGHNSQLYGPQHYLFPATYYQPPTPTCVSYTTSQTPSSNGEVSTSAAADLPSISLDTPKADSNVTAKTITNVNDVSATLKPNQQNSLLNQGVSFGKGGLLGGLPSGYPNPRFGFDGLQLLTLAFCENLNTGNLDLLAAKDQQLLHIILEDNENKPVTNSRDTQEVKLDQGLQLLKLFKDHVSKTSILDDFSFYEDRLKMMQEKRSKQQLLQKKIIDEKLVHFDEKDMDGVSRNPGLQKPLEVKNESGQGGLALGESAQAEKRVALQ